jgi:hypothetical protein
VSGKSGCNVGRDAGVRPAIAAHKQIAPPALGHADRLPDAASYTGPCLLSAHKGSFRAGAGGAPVLAVGGQFLFYPFPNVVVRLNQAAQLIRREIPAVLVEFPFVFAVPEIPDEFLIKLAIPTALCL